MRRQIQIRLSRRTFLAGLGVLPVAATIGPRPLLAAGPVGPATALAFDGEALVLAGNSLWRSDDGGAHWTSVPSNLATPVTALAAHPERPGRLFASLATGGVAVSIDGGSHWEPIGSGLPAGAALALAIASSEPDTLYLSVAGDGLWQSKDAGGTWAFAMDRPWLDDKERDVLALASVGTPSGMGGIWIYAATEQGLTRVPDCFCRWQDIQAGNAMDALVAGVPPQPAVPLPSGEVVRGLAVPLQSPDVIQAATSSGLWRSPDAGVSWVRTHEAAALSIAVDPRDPDHVVAAVVEGVLASHDGGLTWASPEA